MKRLFIPAMLTTLLAVLITGGCLTGGNSNPWSVFVRVAGVSWPASGQGEIPVIWENGGEPQELPTDYRIGGVEGLFVANGDVYASGSAMLTDEATHGVYWKNGEMTVLPGLEGGSTDTIASAVQFHNGSLYLAGTVGTRAFVGLPCLWIDNEIKTLPVLDINNGGSVNDMYIDGETVYTGGFVEEGSQALPAYWRNEEMTYYDCPGAQCIGKAIEVDNGDVYLAVGITYEHHRFEAVYYKNGEIIELTSLSDESQMGWPEDMTVANGKVYVVGYYYAENGNYKPALWVDGELQELSMVDPDLIGSAYAIQVYQGHVFISGDTARMKDPDVTPQVVETIACYWVDGKRVDLPGLSDNSETGVEGSGMAIFVSEY